VTASRVHRLWLYRQMVRIRRFEERVHRLSLEGLVPGATHLAIGQEAVAAGAAGALRPNDPVFCTYRGHHHLIARGAPPDRLLAEIAGWASGVCKGKGGSMHLTSVEHGCYGAYAIVGAHVPVAAGAAYAAHALGQDRVAVAFLGEGATGTGSFHEGLNLAAVWRVPVVYVCENNLYAQYSPASSQALADNPAAARAEANGIPAQVVDGNDVLAVEEAVGVAAARARAGGGPSLVECKTYRHFGHSGDDPAAYRPKEEVAAWLANDPIPRFAALLREAGDAGEEELAAIEREAEGEMAAAEETALGSEPPALEELLADVWAAKGAAWRS